MTRTGHDTSHEVMTPRFLYKWYINATLDYRNEGANMQFIARRSECSH